MTHKTPKFDAALDAILKELKPHEKECDWAEKSPYCEKRFQITDEDIKFYNKLRIPPPKLCPPCRRMRRLGFGLMLRFYKNQCVAPGHTEGVISVTSPALPFKIYDWEYYRTYEWNPMGYGIKPDPSASFFDLFWDLRKVVPQPAIVRDPSNVESDYTIHGRNLKRAYFVVGGWNSERIYYSVSTFRRSEDVMDSYSVQGATNCYEAVFSRDLNNTDFIYFSNDCYASRFMYDSRNCHDCFGCVNLRNKSYCFFNEQLTKEAYEKRLQEIDLGKRSELVATQKRFWDLVKSQPARATRNEQSIESIGNYVLESRNCYEGYVAERCENVRFADQTVGSHDSMDYAVSGGSTLLYETNGVGSQCSNVKFSFGSKFVTDSEFVINCRSISNCFGCIGLENQSYCIFNRKYQPEEYERTVDEIKTAMLARGEYGELFPLKFSSYAYNDSFADLVFPLTEGQVKALDAVWSDESKDDGSYKNLEFLRGSEIPDDIENVRDEILSKTLMCEVTNRPFRIIADELEFYRRKHLPLPTIHPNERIRRRYVLANPYRLYDEMCAKCHNPIKSMYQKKDGFRIYCESCYQAEVL